MSRRCLHIFYEALAAQGRAMRLLAASGLKPAPTKGFQPAAFTNPSVSAATGDTRLFAEKTRPALVATPDKVQGSAPEMDVRAALHQAELAGL